MTLVSRFRIDADRSRPISRGAHSRRPVLPLVLVVGLLIGLCANASSSFAQRMSDGNPEAPVRPAAYPSSERPEAAERTSTSLIDRYQRARLRMLANRMQSNQRGRVPAKTPARIAVASDSLRSAVPSQVSEPAEEPAFPVHEARPVRKLERGWFEQTFEDTQWSFLGAGRYFSAFDTTMTRDLRARMQAVFGNPTQTLGDFNLRKPRDQYVQFEYWIVVNDSIPVKVTDANGALDRGLIVSTSAEYRDQLRAFRRALLSPIMEADPAPYVDYYFESETRRWYRAGYDGERYFLDRVYRYEMTPNRRPWIETDPVSSRSPSPDNASPDNASPDVASSDGTPDVEEGREELDRRAPGVTSTSEDM